jgi:hypothetical protein
MLPGVELARRRRVHYHGDVVGVGGGDHHQKLGRSTSHAATGMVGPALAARNRLQEKLRGAASRSSSTSTSSRFVPHLAYYVFSDNNRGKTEYSRLVGNGAIFWVKLVT